jgi:hypothetical protein
VFHTGTRRASLATCWGGHCESAVTSADAVVPVPEGLDLGAPPAKSNVASVPFEKGHPEWKVIANPFKP